MRPRRIPDLARISHLAYGPCPLENAYLRNLKLPQSWATPLMLRNAHGLYRLSFTAILD
jgi:hypothetical protein